jgi:hypothetical protein
MSRRAALALVVAAAFARALPARAADADPAALVEALANDDAQVRYDAYRDLLASHPPEALPLLAKRVPTLPLAAQSFGTSIVQGYPADRTKPVYEKWAASDAPYVRIFAGANLARQGDAKGAAAVVSALKAEGTDPAALSMGLSQLTGLRDASVTAAVRGLVRPGTPAAVLGPALYHLQFVDDREAPRVVGPLLSSADVGTRALAAAFLWRTGDEARLGGTRRGARVARAPLRRVRADEPAPLERPAPPGGGPRRARRDRRGQAGRLVPAHRHHAPRHVGPRQGRAGAPRAARRRRPRRRRRRVRGAREGPRRAVAGTRALLTGADEAQASPRPVLRRRTTRGPRGGRMPQDGKPPAPRPPACSARSAGAAVDPLIDALLDPDTSTRGGPERARDDVPGPVRLPPARPRGDGALDRDA